VLSAFSLFTSPFSDSFFPVFCATIIKHPSSEPVMLGRITGKATTIQFSFEITPGAVVRKFEYVKVMHRTYGWVLCQLLEIEVSRERSVARCHIMGYNDPEGKVKQIRIPFDMDSEVFLAEDEFIGQVIRIAGGDKDTYAYIGLLEGKEIPIKLDLSKLLTKHVAVLAKSGAGKSYAVGVLVEEILEHNVPVIVIDPHGEYGCLNQKNEEEKDKKEMARFKVKPKAYKVREYGDPQNPDLIPLRLPANLSSQEFITLIPGKMNNTQLGILYGAIKGMEHLNIDGVIMALESEESSAKWSIINILENLRSLGVFSVAPVPYNELVKSGTCSVMNMRGIPPEIQQIIVYKLAKDLFELRKVNKVPPFFLVVEEAHNYCPERAFGESVSNKILRTIASEGRKFGLGLCIISQRPARVDKSVVSQCTTQIILKVTNPNDLKAITSSVEGITPESEEEIQNLQIGTALVTGVVDVPLFVNIRPRRTKHGGHAVNILEQPKEDFMQQATEFSQQALLPLVKPKSASTAAGARRLRELKPVLVPGYVFTCKEKDDPYKILVDATNGEIVMDLEKYATARLPDLKKLSPAQLKILQVAHAAKGFTKEELVKKANAALEVDDEIKDLVQKGYLAIDTATKRFVVTKNYILSKLSKHPFPGSVEYEKIEGERLPIKFNVDQLKEALHRFTNVLDQQECNIVRYEQVKQP